MEKIKGIKDNISKVIVGKDAVVDYTGNPQKQGTELPKHSYQANLALEHIFKTTLMVLLMILVLYRLFFLYCYLKRDRKDEGDVVEFIKKEEENKIRYQNKNTLLGNAL